MNYATPRYSVEKTTSYKGARHWKSVLTEDDVRLINSLLVEGLSQSEIAKKFDVKRQVIHNISTGRSWSHVV